MLSISFLVDPEEQNHKGPMWIQTQKLIKTSVGDPYPDVFGPPGFESVSASYESGSGSFYHQAKIVRKTFIPPVFVTSL
jgi:hypothetical protein